MGSAKGEAMRWNCDPFESLYAGRRALAYAWRWYISEEDLPYCTTEVEVDSLFRWIGEHPTEYHVQVPRECSSCDAVVLLRGGCACCGYCEACCECATCDACDSPTSDTCSGCGHCDSCCSCRTCCGCDRIRADVCSDCDYCNRCGCDCGSSNGLEYVSEGKPWRDGSRRLCGVEWEINSVETGQPVNAWAARWSGGIHDDGSCGHECVTPPIAGKHISACIGDLGRAYTDAGAKADARCGLHVHVDASDYRWPDMFRLLRVFAHIEPLLFALAGQNRIAGNSYCPPTGAEFLDVLSARDPKGALLELMGGGRARRRSMRKKDGGRYRSLNVLPWVVARTSRKVASDCTVEFRLHRDTLDANRVAGWATLCIAIVDYCAKASDAEVSEICKLSALRALAKLAPDSRGWVMRRLAQWRAATSMAAVRRGKAQRRVSYRPVVGWRAVSL